MYKSMTFIDDKSTPCRDCNKPIYFQKNAAGRWVIYEDGNRGGNGMKVLVQHQCQAKIKDKIETLKKRFLTIHPDAKYYINQGDDTIYYKTHEILNCPHCRTAQLSWDLKKNNRIELVHIKIGKKCKGVSK